MSKWKYTIFSFLKTHSAYMLFYKRMEPEEESGKEYKFDVSSELLEVWVNGVRELVSGPTTLTIASDKAACR